MLRRNFLALAINAIPGIPLLAKYALKEKEPEWKLKWEKFYFDGQYRHDLCATPVRVCVTYLVPDPKGPFSSRSLPTWHDGWWLDEGSIHIANLAGGTIISVEAFAFSSKYRPLQSIYRWDASTDPPGPIDCRKDDDLKMLDCRKLRVASWRKKRSPSKGRPARSETFSS